MRQTIGVQRVAGADLLYTVKTPTFIMHVVIGSCVRLRRALRSIVCSTTSAVVKLAATFPSSGLRALRPPTLGDDTDAARGARASHRKATATSGVLLLL